MFERNEQIYGKHNEMLSVLQPTGNDRLEESKAPFKRMVDVYLAAAITGISNHRTSPQDGTQVKREIFAEQLSSVKSELQFAYRLVMLLDESRGTSSKQKIDDAFRVPASGEETVRLNENMELFRAYVRGGIEILYDKLIQNENTSNDDIFYNVIDLVTESVT